MDDELSVESDEGGRMTTRRTSAAAVTVALFGALCMASAIVAQGPQSQVQNPQIQVQRPTLPVEPVMSKMQIDDTVAVAAALPLADLTVKEMCLEHDRKTGWNSLRITLTNIGAADAGPFELGVVFMSPGGAEKLLTDKIAGLKAGQDQSQAYAPICCGWTPTNFLVDTSEKFRAIADPKYYKVNPSYPMGMEVKPVIRESNEKNNEMTMAKSELKPCAVTIQRIDRPQSPVIRRP